MAPRSNTWGYMMIQVRFISTWALLLFAMALCNLLRPSAVQAQKPVMEGDRVRLTIRLWPQAIPTTLIGVLLSDSSDSLTVDTGAQHRTVSRDVVQRLEISRGQKSNMGRGALIGLLGGGVVLGSVSALAWGCDDTHSLSECEMPAFGIGALIGGLGGIIVGTAVGTFIFTDQWEQLPVDTSLGIRFPKGNRPGEFPMLTIRVGF